MIRLCDTIWYYGWIIDMSCEKRRKNGQMCAITQYGDRLRVFSLHEPCWLLFLPRAQLQKWYEWFFATVSRYEPTWRTRVSGVTGVPPSCIEQAELASCSSAPVKVKCQLPPVAGLGLETFGSTCSLDTGIMQTWNHNCFHSPGNRYRYKYIYCTLGISILINGLGKLTNYRNSTCVIKKTM